MTYIYELKVGDKMTFDGPSKGDIFEYVKYEYKPANKEHERPLVTVKLKNLSKEEDFSYCHPLYPVFLV